MQLASQAWLWKSSDLASRVRACPALWAWPTHDGHIEPLGFDLFQAWGTYGLAALVFGTETAERDTKGVTR